MRSHEYSFGFRGAVRLLGPTAFMAFCLVALLKIGDALGILPAPAVSADPDMTLLVHQSHASHTRHPAEIVLLGDSTCLVGVDAPGLSMRLPGRPRVINLSLLIGFGLDVYGKVLQDFVTANEGQVSTAVLLVTPIRFAGTSPSTDSMAAWMGIHYSHVHPGGDPFGIKVLRGNLLSHVLETPLHGNGAAYFGFSSEIDAYMTAHDGSLIDFGRLNPLPGHPGSAKWTVPSAVGKRSRAFRAEVPAGVKLFIGFTPGPASRMPPGASEERIDLLREWNQAIGADALLTNLPASLPDAFYSKTAHLNATGQREFTMILAEELAAALDQAE